MLHSLIYTKGEVLWGIIEMKADKLKEYWWWEEKKLREICPSENGKDKSSIYGGGIH